MTRRSKKRAYADATTRNLARSGVLKVEVKGHGRRREKVRVPYSFAAAVKSITLLTVLLWWLPTFGQMIAGYVGGRRAGSPWKAALAACVPVVVFYGATYAARNGYFTDEMAFIVAIPSMLAQAISSNVPVMAPYVQFVTAYVTTLVEVLKATLVVGLEGYMVTIIFAYVGGVVAQQRLREMRYTGFGAPSTTVVTAPLSSMSPAMHRAPAQPINAQRYGDLRKIPVVVKGATPARRTRRRAKRKLAPERDSPEAPLQGRAEKRQPKYDKGTINRRLVERALDHYKQESR